MIWCRKSQKILTASDQYFLSYVKKTTGGPPPAGIGLIYFRALTSIQMCIYSYHKLQVLVCGQMINYPDCFHLIERDVQRYLTVESGTKILLLPVLSTSLYALHTHNSSICQFVNCQFINLSIHQFFNSSICQFVNLSIRQFVNLSIRQFVNSSIFPFVNLKLC